MNHNGDVEIAKELVRQARHCGADAVKFQTYKAERVVAVDAPKANYQLKTTDSNESQIEMLKKLEMPEKAYYEIVECCHEHDIVFLSTPYNVEDVDFLDNLGVSAFKLASISAAEPWFAAYTASKEKPIILSTGMATLTEVGETVSAIQETGNKQLILLQCTTNYPSRLEDANLSAMQTMGNAFGLQIGYSDHTQDSTACIVSIALGAKVIEKHFTLDKSLPGPDQSSSADIEEFKCLVKNIRNAENILGSSIKQPCKNERQNIKGMRRSIVAKQEIKEGSLITEQMLTFKRPATGIKPSLMYSVLNKKANKRIKPDSIIDWNDLKS